MNNNHAFRFEFNEKRSLAAFLIATKSSQWDIYDNVSYRRIMNLLYFIDKTFLEKCNRSFTGTVYYPESSGVMSYEIMNSLLDTDNQKTHSYAISKYDINCSSDHFDIYRRDIGSNDDFELVARTYEAFKNFPPWYLSQIAKDDAWKKAKDRGDFIRFEDIAELLENEDDLKNMFSNTK